MLFIERERTIFLRETTFSEMLFVLKIVLSQTSTQGEAWNFRKLCTHRVNDGNLLKKFIRLRISKPDEIILNLTCQWHQNVKMHI